MAETKSPEEEGWALLTETELRDLEEERDRLRAALVEAEAALEHYADLRNWKPYFSQERECKVYDRPGQGFSLAAQALEGVRAALKVDADG
jgi:hypothetical protein